MKRTISLYIAGRLADIAEDALILYNYTREELSNPTIVKNSYSHAVTLEGTPRNNAIFGNMGRLDRVTTAEGYNALKRADFAIFSDKGEILESGYCKLDKVDKVGSRIQYSVSLFGGLGDFFYNLSFDAEGTPRTLADMVYGAINPKQQAFPLTAAAVKSAWSNIGGTNALYNIANFAPAYNGIPENFDANKAIYRAGNDTAHAYNNILTSREGYGPKSTAAGYVLLEMSQPHNEWQVRDLRAYLQRPVVRLKEIIAACCDPANNGGYTVHLEGDFFQNTNAYWEDTWVTMPIFDREKVSPASATLADVIGNSAAPAQYLIGMAKMFGLVFLKNAARKEITICSRSYFFNDRTPIDLTKRIDTKRGLSIVPVLAENKYYTMSAENKTEIGSRYADQYGREYGGIRIDTANDFSEGTKSLTEGLVYKGGADYQARGSAYMLYGAGWNGTTSLAYVFTIGNIEDVQYTLYKSSGSTEENKAFSVVRNTYHPMSSVLDMFPKVQLYEEGEKAGDGSNVLLFFNGKYNFTPVEGLPYLLHLSNDNDTVFAALNGGKPCWDATIITSTNHVSSLPVFRRVKSLNGVISKTLEYAEPLEWNVPNEAFADSTVGVYWDAWAQYISDRFDKDTKVMKCRVNLRGLEVSESLMRHFFFYDNALWVLNKISNHSITTDDTTECEFVKVNDISKY